MPLERARQKVVSVFAYRCVYLFAALLLLIVMVPFFGGIGARPDRAECSQRRHPVRGGGGGVALARLLRPFRGARRIVSRLPDRVFHAAGSAADAAPALARVRGRRSIS